VIKQVLLFLLELKAYMYFKVDKTFDVTECRIYLFKGVIKQIQMNRNSRVTNADDIKKIGN
jgi:hypothetical protein